MNEPVIKWSGSKRSQATEILKYFPKQIGTYFEPFVGGGSVVRALLESDIKVDKYVCSDLNGDLINLWNVIKNQPEQVSGHYRKLWLELNVDDDCGRKRTYFNTVRERYNLQHDPSDFMFIMRTTTNGMPRYNRNGEFNNSFHITRNGINPDTLETIINEWSKLLNDYDVEFIHCDYRTITPAKGDFVYMDPPYAATKGMYFGDFNVNEFFNFIQKLKVPYAFSFDGKSGQEDNTFQVPNNAYDEHIYLKSGNSSFKRVIGKDKNAIVYESLYLKNN